MKHEESHTKGELCVVGLGPGNPDSMSLGAWRALSDAEFVILRTRIHPTVSFLDEEGITYVSCDDIYEAAGDFDTAYEQVVDRVMQAALSGLRVAYAVPGHPSVFESTTGMLRRKCAETGVPLRIAGSEAFLEPVLQKAGIDPSDGLLILDALTLKASSLAPGVPCLIAQVYDRTTASSVKLTLAEVYGDDHPVTVLRAAGVPGEEWVETVPISRLDHLEWLDHLVTVYVPPVKRDAVAGQAGPGMVECRDGVDKPSSCDFPMDPLVRVVSRLRGEGGCPWDKEQDHRSLRPFVLEEAYEVVEAIELGDMHKLCEELGDLLLQLALHSQISAEQSHFDVNDVVAGITQKMIRRHPHVFSDVKVSSSDDVLRNWQTIKAAEKGTSRASVITGVSKHLPAMMRAHEIQRRAAKVGFDWPSVEQVFDKVREETGELERAREAGDAQALEAETGDLLFAITNLSRHLGVMPEQALAGAVTKFTRRFRFVEDEATKQGKKLEDMSLEEMDHLWERAKALGL
ncbi:MAG: nucleoside triphosphate pyrophosphohydrolase [Bacillota bacterium]|nr:nucleoside triphosphate pyrophosphohydrolase [Bacillota bacterium]